MRRSQTFPGAAAFAVATAAAAQATGFAMHGQEGRTCHSTFAR
jgi:hypothetical protein